MNIIEEIISPAVDSYNQFAEEPAQLEVDASTPLLGDGAQISSLDLVDLIMEIESQIEVSIGKKITLADDKAMSRRKSPFRTMGLLTDYVTEILKSSASDE